MMKIIFVINSLYNKAGSERVACLLANLFVEKLNYDVSIVNRHVDKDDSAYKLHEKVKVYNLNNNLIKFLFGLENIIAHERPDFVILHNMGKLSLLCSFLKKRKNCRLYSLEHVSFSSRMSWIKLLAKLFYSRFDRVITLTEKDKSDFYFAKNVSLIRNISPYSNHLAKLYLKQKKIVAIGRLTKQKNFSVLLQAWAYVYPSLPDWELEIYGVGELENSLKKFILDNKLQRVQLLGQADDMERVYKQSSFIVISSLYEGLPMALIEAQSFGVPAISFDCPYGPSEIITDQMDGILVENQNIEKLSQAILELASNPDKLSLYSENSLVSSKRFSSEVILEQWKKLFKQEQE